MNYSINDTWQLLVTLNEMSQDPLVFTIDQLLEVAKANDAYMDYACCSVLLAEPIDPVVMQDNKIAYQQIIEICRPFYHDLLWSDRYRYELIEQILETL